jgi:hypothetical protein
MENFSGHNLLNKPQFGKLGTKILKAWTYDGAVIVLFLPYVGVCVQQFQCLQVCVVEILDVGYQNFVRQDLGIVLPYYRRSRSF